MSSQPAYSTPHGERPSRGEREPSVSSVPAARPRRRVRPFLLAFLLLVLVWVVSAGILLFCPPALTALSSIWLKPQPSAVPWNGHDRISVLAMGLTQRTTEPARADSLLLLDIDPGAHRINMLSVPRDLYVDVPGYGKYKLAIPYTLGGPQGGAALTAYTLEKSLGIPVDYTISMKFRGFMNLVDSMGGVDVNVPQELNDPTYPCLVGYDYCPIDIKKGQQHMDGKTALEFVRERHAFNQQDLARVKDQQAFSEAVKHQLISPATWPRYPSIFDTLKQSLITNLPLNDLPVVGAQMLLTPKSRIDHQYINISNGMVQPGWTSDGQSILEPTNSTAIPSLVHRLFDDPAIAGEAASVVVLNGTGTDGVASDVQSTLSGLGYRTVGNGNADRSDYARSKIVVNTSVKANVEYTARRLQRLMNADLVHEAIPGQSAAIEVIVGRNFPNS